MARGSKGRFCKASRRRNPVKGDEHAKEIMRLRRKHGACAKALLKKNKKPHRKNLDAFYANGVVHPIRKSKDYVAFAAKGG